jgi:hypothetical protein
VASVQVDLIILALLHVGVSQGGGGVENGGKFISGKRQVVVVGDQKIRGSEDQKMECWGWVVLSPQPLRLDSRVDYGWLGSVFQP